MSATDLIKSPLRFEDWQRMAHLLTNKLLARASRSGFRVEREDVFQHVAMTWMRCRDGFDPERGVTFATYFWQATMLGFGRITRSECDPTSRYAWCLDAPISAEEGDQSAQSLLADPTETIDETVDRAMRLRKIAETHPILGRFIGLLTETPDELNAELEAAAAQRRYALSRGIKMDQPPTQLTPEALSRIFDFNWRSRRILHEEITHAADLLR